jgi:hypothetical protein
MHHTQLINGRKYRFVHRSPLQKFDRWTVAVFLEIDENSRTGAGPEVIMSGRPNFGTSALPLAWIVSIEEVPQTTGPAANRDARTL